MQTEENNELEIKPTSTEQAPIEQAPAEQAPIEQAPTEQEQSKLASYNLEAPAEQAPTEQGATEQAPAEQAPAEQAPTTTEKSFKKYLIAAIIALIFTAGVFFIYQLKFKTEDLTEKHEETEEVIEQPVLAPPGISISIPSTSNEDEVEEEPKKIKR